MNNIRKDLKALIGGSGIVVLTLIGVMFFSPLSSQFMDDSVSRGSSWKIEIDELLMENQTEQALNLVDEMIEAESKDLPRWAYFDRYLSEDEQYEVANVRAEIYDLQWKRIEILKTMGKTDELREVLEDYSKVIGYNQNAAKSMLKQLNSK